MRYYKNPFKLENQWDDSQLGDPFILRHDGRYYLFCSSHRAEIKCWQSDDLVSWNYCGSVCDLPEIDGAYAPEVYFTHGKFYMVTAPKGSGHYMLASDSVTGPYELVSENFGLAIDGSLFADDDGKLYFLRAGHNGIVIHNVELPRSPESTGITIPESYMNYWTEGPMLIKRGGFYFLTMTGNHLLSRGYRVDYAVSAESPTKGYVTLRNKTLLLEVGDEFHALGHSSTVLGPDMDSYYIAYHSFDLTAEPRFRSLNIDRLFFDESRMYTNAAWWHQKVPSMPKFVSRDGEGLLETVCDGKTILVTPPPGDCFTVEMNINPKGKSVEVYMDMDEKPWRIGPDGISFPDMVKPLPPSISMEANITIRISRGERYVRLWLNGLLIRQSDKGTESPASGIGLWSEAGVKPGFVGFSHVAEGSADRTSAKNVPGSFLAVHADMHTEPGDEITVSYKEFSLPAQAVHGSFTSLDYRINVKSAGAYSLFIRCWMRHKNPRITVNGQRFRFCGTGMDGFYREFVGVIKLPAGETYLNLSMPKGILLMDEIFLVPFNESPERLEVVKEGRLVCNDLRIMGHKKTDSMIRKEWGFTCAENHGMGFIGEDGWKEYTIDLHVNINLKSSGSCSVYLRATKESWFEHQASPSLLGYRVCINNTGITLYRCHYGEKELGRISIDGSMGSKQVNVVVQVKDGLITAASTWGQVTYLEAEPHLCGKVGIEATGEGWGFKEFVILRYGTI